MSNEKENNRTIAICKKLFATKIVASNFLGFASKFSITFDFEASFKNNSFKSFGNTDTKQVMSPRIDIFALEIEETFEEIYPKIVEKGYSRIPIFKDNIDTIIGDLFVKDLIPHIQNTKPDVPPYSSTTIAK